MKILYLTQWFDPEPGVVKGLDFARALEAAGHEVTVVTGIPNYPEGRFYQGYRLRPFQQEIIDGIKVHRLPLYPSHDASWVRRALSYLSFFATALVYGLLRARRFDLVYVYHPPITVGLAAALFCAVHRRPFILDVQDLWPETVGRSGMSAGRRLTKIIGEICEFVYRRADRVIAQSEGFEARIGERGGAGRTVAIRNWADEAVIERGRLEDRHDDRPERAFRIVYGGNLGRAQNLEPVVQAAHKAGQIEPSVELVLIGDGIDAADLQALAARIGATNVRFVKRVPKDEIVGHFHRADALIIHLATDPLFAITIPQKTQFYLAMGKPIIAGVDGEAAAMLDESGAALVVPSGDVDALAQAMVTLARADPSTLSRMAHSGRSYYDRHLSFDQGVAATLNAIETTMNEWRRAS